MEQKITIPEDVLIGYRNAAYDQNAKRILAQRKILAHIVKRTVPEFLNVPLDDIAAKHIEGDPLISTVPVNPDKTNATKRPREITGDRTEDSSPTEGWVTFDILFHARVPLSGELITLIVNIEAQRTQNEADLGYILLKRAFYYGCRIVSSQKETEFTGTDYNGIKKVYTIWICMDSPDGQSAINRYEVKEHHLLHRHKEPVGHYDLMCIVMVYLGKRAAKDRLIRLLQVLFTETKKSAKEKEQVLRDEYAMEITPDLEEELNTMCNLSEGIALNAMKQGLAQGMLSATIQNVKNLVKSMGVSPEQAMEVLGVSADLQPKVLEAL